jgi:hypothetical protein
MLGPVIAVAIPIHRVDPPQTILDHLPPIDSSFGRGIDSIVIGHGGPGLRTPSARREPNEPRNGSARSADSNPRVGQAAVSGVAAPGRDRRTRPRSLHRRHDRPDRHEQRVGAGEHARLFARAVRDALPAFLFKPAELGGHRVRALAEMPFEFQITK